MAIWKYQDASGNWLEARGRELKQLAREGKITPRTRIEDENGNIVRAEHVQGLPFTETASSVESSVLESDIKTSTWYYYDNEGQKQGPITGGRLKGLAKAGMIVPGTMVVSKNGKAVPAAQVKGLTFVKTTLSAIIPPQIVTTTDTENGIKHTAEDLGEQDFEQLRKDFEQLQEQETFQLQTPERSTLITPPAEPNPFAVAPPEIAAPPVAPTPETSQTIPQQVPVPIVENLSLLEKLKSRPKPVVITGIAVVVVASLFCLSLPLLNNGANKDKELVKTDLREINDYATWNDFSNITKYINLKRAENFETWKRAAEKGIPDGQVLLGWCYYYGAGVSQDWAIGGNWYRKAAEQGHAEGQYRFGLCYYKGEGVPEDEAEAVKWFRKAAEQGFAEAQCKIGICYFRGESVPKDETEAVTWFRKAAEQGHAEARLELGLRYDFGEGVPENKTEAVKWYRQAAEQGHAVAQYMLGLCYYKGEGVLENEAEAVKWFRKSAEQGQVNAQYILGECYRLGTGITEDNEEATKWLSKASEQGHKKAIEQLQRIEDAVAAASARAGVRAARETENEQKAEEVLALAIAGNAVAQYIIGMYYTIGKGVPQNAIEAAKWFRRAADQGDEDAQYQLGMCYYKGEGVSKNNAEATRWLRLAEKQGVREATVSLREIAKEELAALRKTATQGDAQAQYMLGMRYLKGDSIAPRNTAETITWLRRAAEQGHAEAQYQLGMYYGGTARDQDEAVKWFREAAERGNRDAQYQLGRRYFRGENVPKDNDEAAKWLRKAAEQGHGTAATLLRDVLGIRP